MTEPPRSLDGWLVIWAESRAERKVAVRSAAAGFESWFPVTRERHRWSDRWREVEVPLFPGYLFARSKIVDWSRVLRIPGVLTVVKEAGTPAYLADSFILELRQVIERPDVTPKPISDCTDYAQGDEVIVQEGPLAGVRGIVREQRSSRQLILWVAEIGRGVAFTIGAAMVSKAAPKSQGSKHHGRTSP